MTLQTSVPILKNLASPDGEIRFRASQEAVLLPIGELPALIALAESETPGVAKAARRALELRVHHAARPGAPREAAEVAQILLSASQTSKVRSVRAKALSLLGCVGDSRVVFGLARLLQDPEVHEEARMALERIPGSASTEALRRALKERPASEKPALEQSLRRRAATPKTAGIKP